MSQGEFLRFCLRSSAINNNSEEEVSVGRTFSNDMKGETNSNNLQGKESGKVFKQELSIIYREENISIFIFYLKLLKTIFG